MKRSLLITMLCLFTASASLWGQQFSILFVGNSLTYTNDLPGMMESLGKAFEIEVRTGSRCLPNYALEDHWRDGEVQQLIATGNYGIVVFQQGPSSQPPGKEMLVQYGGNLADLCRKHDVRPAFFMVWPSLQYYHTFEGVIANYQEAAVRADALLFPVGAVWKTYRGQHAEAALYAQDGFHPSPQGSFLAALTIFHTLFPDQHLGELPFKKFKKWAGDSATFEEMIDFVTAY